MFPRLCACGQVSTVSPTVCHPLSGQVDTVGEELIVGNIARQHLLNWMKELTWDMVGLGVINTVEVKSLGVEVVSSVVDKAVKQRRLVKANKKQEMHLVMEVVNEEVEERVERLKADRLKRSEDKTLLPTSRAC